MNASNCRASERGQALPLAVASLFCAALLFAFVLKGSERLIQRERVRARTDVTAFSGGVSYARGLNLLAASQKVVAGTWVWAIADKGKLKNHVQKFQNQFLKYGPWVTQTTIVNVGAENKLIALPFWNQEVLFEKFEKESMWPGYNVTPYLVSDAIVAGMKKATSWFKNRVPSAIEPSGPAKKALDAWNKQQLEKIRIDAATGLKKHLPELDMEGLYKTSHYEYRRKNGDIVKVPVDEGFATWENGPAKKSKVLRHKAGKKHKHRYLREIPEVNENFQLSLEEHQPHMLTIAALQYPGGSGRPGWVMAMAQVLVNGGGMSLVDPDGSGYGATLVPVALFPEQGWELEAPRMVYRYALDKDLNIKSPPIGMAARFGVNEALNFAQGALEAVSPGPEANFQALRALNFVRELQLVQH